MSNTYDIKLTAKNRVEVDGEEFVADELLDLCEEALVVSYQALPMPFGWSLHKTVVVRNRLRQELGCDEFE